MGVKNNNKPTEPRSENGQQSMIYQRALAIHVNQLRIIEGASA